MLSNTLKSFLFVAAACVILLVASTTANAATATTTFQVTATIQATCVVTANPLGFGTYTGAVANGTTTISVTCTDTTPFDVGLNAGTASGATVTTRQMAGPNGALLNYALYTDAARTLNWDDAGGTTTVSGTGDGSAQSLTVYGQIPAGQYLEPGAYADTITATVTY